MPKSQIFKIITLRHSTIFKRCNWCILGACEHLRSHGTLKIKALKKKNLRSRDPALTPLALLAGRWQVVGKWGLDFGAFCTDRKPHLSMACQRHVNGANGAVD
jgi:hypothetical protein